MIKKTSIKNCLSHFGLFSTINITIVIIAFVMLLIISILLTNNFLYPSVQQSILLKDEASQQLLNTFSQKYRILYNNSVLFYNPDQLAYSLSSYLQPDHSENRYASYLNIGSTCKSFLYSDPDIMDVVLVSETGELIYSISAMYSHKITASYQYQDLPIVQKAIKSNHGIVVSYMESEPYSNSDQQVITYCIRVKDPYLITGSEYNGLLLVSYPLDIFSNAYNRLGAFAIGQVHVIDEQKNIIFSSEEQLLGSSISEELETNFDITRYSISTSGMTLINAIPKNYSTTSTIHLVTLLLTILVPSFALIIIVIILLNKQYKHRIDNLVYTMQHFSDNEKYAPIPIQFNDELGKLTAQFNLMCEKLDQQIKIRYKSEVARKTAELNALQAQINPHFLYNTIESIRMCALKNSDLEVSDMLIQLGRLFHWMIQLDKHIVYLEDEVEYNESYLTLQAMRYQDSFKSQFNIQEEALYLGVPKFTLQPIIENAVLHGLQENSILGKITIDASIHNHKLIIKVSDNGYGMPTHTLERLKRHIASETNDPSFGIGMRNVHSRIQMLFGDEYGINIDSLVKAGTTVTITLPAIPKKELEAQIGQTTISQ